MDKVLLVMGGKIDNVVSNVVGLVDVVMCVLKKGLLLVYLWNLFFCGDLDMEICVDGMWFYQGMFIGWYCMVQLFVLILKCEGDVYFFVMFVEKVGICVVDVFFIVVDVQIGEMIIFIINVGDIVVVGFDYVIELWGMVDQLCFYFYVWCGLWVLIDCKIFYRLVDVVMFDVDGCMGL